MKSKWVNEIEGYEELTGYKVYEDGTVESYITRHDKDWVISDKPRRILKPYKTKKGYLKVDIRHKSISHHRLVATAFITNPGHKPQINHIDADKTNNHANNLEWCSGQENHSHKMEHGLNVTKSGSEHYLYGKKGAGHHTSKAVAQIDDNENVVATFGSAREAGRKLGKHYSSISKCCNGHLDKAFGYSWKYL